MLAYDSIQKLVEAAEKQNKSISEVCLEDQAESMGLTKEEVFKQMEEAFDVMVDSVKTGMDENLRSTSGLTGGEGFKMLRYANQKDGGISGTFMSRAMARAMAVSNCNAAMGKVVASPTAGSCGIVPGCLVSMYEEGRASKEEVVMSMFVAGAFGMVVANKASVAGAEGGCQAECGSASGMAAASMVELYGGTPQQCADALGMCIINQLGLVCDPVAGLVEIPCIKRNVSGLVIAISSADMALSGIELYIPADECIDAMREVGDSMPCSLKETACGGLAVTPTGKKLMEKVFGTKDYESTGCGGCSGCGSR